MSIVFEVYEGGGADGTTLTVGAPSEMGDLMIAFLITTYGQAVSYSDYGWDLVGTQELEFYSTLSIFSRVQTSGGPDYSFGLSPAGDFEFGACIYRGADSVDAYSIVSRTNTASSITTTVTNDELLSMFFFATSSMPHGQPTMSVPVGETQRALDFHTIFAPSGGYSQMSISDETVASAGATGNRAITITNGVESVSATWAALVALTPASGVIPVQVCTVMMY